jgi:hypothetical protein
MGAFTPPKRHPYIRRLSVAMRSFFSWCDHFSMSFQKTQKTSSILSLEGALRSFFSWRGFGGWPPIINMNGGRGSARRGLAHLDLGLQGGTPCSGEMGSGREGSQQFNKVLTCVVKYVNLMY